MADPLAGQTSEFGGSSSGSIPRGSLKTLGGYVYQFDGQQWYNTGVRDTQERTDTTPDVRYDASGRAFLWSGGEFVPAPQFDDPRKASGYTPPAAPRYPESGISGGYVYTRDPYTGAVTFGERVPGSMTEQETVATQMRAAELTRQAQAQEAERQRQFQAGESDISRAIEAGQFAATLEQRRRADQFAAEQDYQTRLRQYAQDRLSAAQAFASQVGAVDPAALEAFYAAGGGNIANALAGGASAVSENAVLPAARTLRATREMVMPTRYSGFDAPIPAPVYSRPTEPAKKVVPPAASAAAPSTTTSGVYDPLGLQAQWAAGLAPSTQPSVAYSTPTVEQPRFPALANEDVGMDAPRFPSLANEDVLPRYAFGTMGEPAKGEFMVGDSTHPTDPFAGGARPEKVTLKDPPGPNNAEAEVEPMSEPMGEHGNKFAEVLHAIASFLDGGDMERYAYGTMKRYAYGTGYETISPTPEDQSYMQEVRNIRQNVQFPQLNPYSTKFAFTPPSLRERYFAGMQTKYGVPVEDQMAEQRRYALSGASRAYSLGV